AHAHGSAYARVDADGGIMFIIRSDSPNRDIQAGSLRHGASGHICAAKDSAVPISQNDFNVRDGIVERDVYALVLSDASVLNSHYREPVVLCHGTRHDRELAGTEPVYTKGRIWRYANGGHTKDGRRIG